MWSILIDLFKKKSNVDSNDSAAVCRMLQSEVDRPSFMDLPEEILSTIFDFLYIKDQISVALASQQFEDVLKVSWRKTYQNRTFFKYSGIENRDLIMIMKSICETVEKKCLTELKPEQWNIIKQYNYPSVIELELSFNHEEFPNDYVEELIKLYPNLRSLQLGGRQINGRNIICFGHLKFLEHLDLCYGPLTLEFNEFEKFFDVMQLKSLKLKSKIQGCHIWKSKKALNNFCALERVCCNSYGKVLLSNLANFTNLKELEGDFYDKEDSILFDRIFRSISEYKRNNLTEFQLSIDYPLHSFLQRRYVNLKKLVMYNKNLTDLPDISTWAPNLREIVFCMCERLKKEQIFQLLNSTQLELIDVSKCRCEFHELNFDVDDIVKKRKKLLQFNFYMNYLETFSLYSGPMIEINVESTSALFKITSDCTFHGKYQDFVYKFQ